MCMVKISCKTSFLKTILFLTTANLATNPRLLKEITLFSGQYSVTAVMFELGNWSDAKTENLIQQTETLQNVKFIKLNTTRKPIGPWLFWGMLEALGKFIYPMLKRNITVNALANSRRSFQILRAGLKLDLKQIFNPPQSLLKGTLRKRVLILK